LLQIIEALVCLSAIYVVKSADSATKTALSPNWLLPHLLYNAIDILYMQFGEWVARFDPANSWRMKQSSNVSGIDLVDINFTVSRGGWIN